MVMDPLSVIRPLNLNSSGGGVSRQSVNKDFAAKLRQASGQTARALQNTANYVAPIAPGAAILSAGLGNIASNLGGSDAGGLPAGPAGDGSDMIKSMGDMQENLMSRSVQMLALQTKVQQNAETFQMQSNVLKTTHDSKKNAISNLR